jgi:hypothetical protein
MKTKYKLHRKAKKNKSITSFNFMSNSSGKKIQLAQPNLNRITIKPFYEELSSA